MKFLNNIDLNLNQILNSLAQNLGTDPTTPVEGQFWYSTTTHQLRYYNGTAIVSLYPSSSADTPNTNVLRDGSGNVTVNKVFVDSSTPVAANELTTKSYVDAIAAGLQWKSSVRAATTANIALVGAQTVDGVSLVAGDRVLVKNQTVGSQNGIYVVATGSWPRSSDAATDPQLADGAAVFVDEGTTQQTTSWVQTTNNPVTIGTTSLVFAQFNGGQSYAAGNGIALTGNVFSVTTANSGRIVVGSTGVDLASGVVTAGTYNSVTVDTYGRVTGGTNVPNIGKYSTDIGDGTSTSYTITHNLNTKDISVTFRDNITPYAEVRTDWQATTVNSITVMFSTAPIVNKYRAIVIG